MPKSLNIKEKTITALITKGVVSPKELMRELKISKSTLYKYLKKYKIVLPEKELYFDNTVFDIIDSEKKAYWLGFLYADGFINGKYNNSVELSLKGEDIGHLNKFNEFIKNKRPIKLSFTGKDHKFTRCRCIITDKHFHDQLVLLGCVPNKSLVTKFPSMKIFQYENLIYPFLRGYLDGDGSIMENKKSGRLVISFLGTKEFLEGIMNVFKGKFKSLHSTRSSKLGKNHYEISCSFSNADQVGSLLYKDFSICLERKYKKFAKLCRNA